MASRVAERLSFAKIPEILPLPDLLAVQHESFQWFLDEGLKEIFDEIIDDASNALATLDRLRAGAENPQER